MNQRNTIKSMIPQQLVENVPLASRESWAERIVEIFLDNVMPEEERKKVVNEIIQQPIKFIQKLLTKSSAETKNPGR